MTMTNIELCSGQPCLIIAEVGLGHDGSLGLAHAYVDAVAAAGADAVKFQTHIAAAESTAAEPFRVEFSRQDETRYDYWMRMEFTERQWLELADHAREQDVIFLSSPFSIEAVELLDRVGTPMWKIASGEVSNEPMLDRIAETKQPVLLSSGMSNLAELDLTVRRLQDRGVSVGVLQCTTVYPCPPKKIGLNLLDMFRQRYNCAVGLSDHSGAIYAGLAAVTLGAEIVEVHVTMSREMFGPDVPASLTTSELRQLTDGIRFIEQMRANPVDKDALASELDGLRTIFTKSLVTRQSLEAGTVLALEHLAFKKPGTGIPAARLTEIVGRRLRRRVEADTVLSETDLKGVELK